MRAAYLSVAFRMSGGLSGGYRYPVRMDSQTRRQKRKMILNDVCRSLPFRTVIAHNGISVARISQGNSHVQPTPGFLIQIYEFIGSRERPVNVAPRGTHVCRFFPRVNNSPLGNGQTRAQSVFRSVNFAITRGRMGEREWVVAATGFAKNGSRAFPHARLNDLTPKRRSFWLPGQGLAV